VPKDPARQSADQSKTVKTKAEMLTADSLFEKWDETEFIPQDFMIAIPVNSLESQVGYSSLYRQMHDAFMNEVAFHRSVAGGSLTLAEARKRAFRACQNKEEAKKLFSGLMQMPVDQLDFVELSELHAEAPRVAERLWELAKREGRKEFESGHLAANAIFPVNHMKILWNIAKYLGTRESFVSEWKPRGATEMVLIDMMAQSHYQWLYWLEQTVRRSETREHEEHPDYKEWKRLRMASHEKTWSSEGYWLRPYVSEQEAIEHAVQMADRWNRMFLRTLRQLRDLRRYTVTINNPNQVNIASDGGQQLNVTKITNDNPLIKK
jgi:hypothetical protein